MKLNIENVQSEETAQLAQLASEIWREYYTSILTAEQIDYMVEKFQSAQAIEDQIRSQGYEYYFLKSGSEYAGYVGINGSDGNALFLSKFYIKKECRGRGYAKEVMEFLTELCRDRGFRKIWLTVNRFNENSINVYEKKGFHKVRTQVADIGNGYVMDDFVMEKEIN